MKKKLMSLFIVLCMTMGLTACGSTDTNSEVASQPSTETESEVASQPSTETESEVTPQPSTETESEVAPQPSTETESEIASEPEKVYDVYVNGVGYDKGVKLEFEVTLTAPDTEFLSCCPSFNVFMEGVTDPVVIANNIEFDSNDDSINPILMNNVAYDEYDLEYYNYWGYYDLLAAWNNPDAEPYDITNGIMICAPQITFKEPGNYTFTVTSGNDSEELRETFAKYDNCFTFTTKVVE